jgi:hypothetical protein
MRLSLMKGAHAVVSGAASRKSGYAPVEMGREGAGGRIFLFPAYDPENRRLYLYGFLVTQFVANARRTRRPVLCGVAGLDQLGRRALHRVRASLYPPSAKTSSFTIITDGCTTSKKREGSCSAIPADASTSFCDLPILLPFASMI